MEPESQAETALREFENRILQLEKQNAELKELVESKEAMMFMMVHDMKNPLTVVMGTLCLLQNKKIVLDPEIKQMVLDANIHAIKLRAMMDDILTISRMRSKQIEITPAVIDLIGLIQQSVLMMNTIQGDKHLIFRFEPARKELPANIDYPMVERIINNILNNAIKYAPAGSELLVEVAPREKFAQVSITNWGVPIPKIHQEKVFEMFYRVDPKDKRISGTGLGLSFCKPAVEAHGGRIWVESPVPPTETGTRFCFTLPLAESQTEA